MAAAGNVGGAEGFGQLCPTFRTAYNFATVIWTTESRRQQLRRRSSPSQYWCSRESTVVSAANRDTAKCDPSEWLAG